MSGKIEWQMCYEEECTHTRTIFFNELQEENAALKTEMERLHGYAAGLEESLLQLEAERDRLRKQILEHKDHMRSCARIRASTQPAYALRESAEEKP